MACEGAACNASMDHPLDMDELPSHPIALKPAEKGPDGGTPNAGNLIAEAIKSTSRLHLESGPHVESKKMGCYESGQLLSSLRETGNKIGLMAKLGPHTPTSLKTTNSIVTKAREKYLERQKMYIQKLTEKRRTEEEQHQQDEKKFNSLRERLKEKVVFMMESISSTLPAHNNLFSHRPSDHNA